MNVAGQDWRLDELGVVGGGLVLALTSFLPWYEARVDLRAVELRGWDLGFAAVVAVLLAAYAAGRVVVFKGRPQRPDVPVTPAAETFTASAAALSLVAYRLLDRPEVPGSLAVRTNWLVLGAFAVLVQAVAAGNLLRRTGLRPAPPE
ncbi:MAG: hypothetical protein QOE45_3100 [Frankiaceae bacterium]|nr:hypothetical protein [Frankiaceae bacterium]